MTIIVDGTGAGYRAAVTSENRIKADVISEDAYVHAAEEGLAFNINTEPFPVSGVGPFGQDLLYIKNNGTKDLEMVGWFIGEANDRNGGNTSEPVLFEMFGNPSGTPVGDDIEVVNRRIGAAKEFDITAKGGISGVGGLTVSGAPLLSQYHYGSRSFGNVNFTIPAGQSIVVRGNFACNSLTLYTGFTGYERI